MLTKKKAVLGEASLYFPDVFSKWTIILKIRGGEISSTPNVPQRVRALDTDAALRRAAWRGLCEQERATQRRPTRPAQSRHMVRPTCTRAPHLVLDRARATNLRLLLCTSAETSAGNGAPCGVNPPMLRVPSTRASAGTTLAALYGGYHLQYEHQLSKQRAVGRPDLGGPFDLQNAAGERVTHEDLMGQWVLLYFGFTKCPDICPQVSQ